MTPDPRPADRGRKIASPPETAEIAVSLARVGWPVFPVTIYEAAGGKRSKVPAVPKGTSWKDWATTDVKAVAAAWAGEHSGRWIGVYAGGAGIVTLDVDTSKDDSRNGFKALDAAELPVTPTPIAYPTPSGGKHFVYAAPAGVDLTIARDLIVDGVKLAGVDVRSGGGLMVYYGPKLKRRDVERMPTAPSWLIVTRESLGQRADGTSDRAPSATEDAYRARLYGDTPDKAVRKALKTVTRDGMSHDDMLAAVTTLVSLGAAGHPGVAVALDAARETYAAGWPDAGRHWDNAVTGSIKRLGLPPVTLELSKTERREIRRRNTPEAIEEATRERKAVHRAVKHRGAVEAAQSGERPMPGERVLEDASLADELAAVLRGTWAYGEGRGIMRYVKSGKAGRWKPAEEHALIEAVRRELVEIEVDEHTAAAMRGDNKGIDKARTLLARGRAAAVSRFVVGILAEDEPIFDAHPDLLNTPSGVVDLRTGKLSKADPALYLTKLTGVAYDPKADRAMWDRACEALHPSVVAWLKVRLGQALTGYRPDDDVLTILEGAGENGKTSWMIGTRKAAGDYAGTLPERLLLADPGDHPTTLMTMMGLRLGVIEELPEGRSLNVKRLKDTVGTPEITARKMRQDDVTFPNTTCLFLATNYLPIVAETDHGTWRRLALVRFRLTYLKPKKYAERKAAGTLTKRHRLGDSAVVRHFEHEPDAGLLAWMIEGARAWYDNGMKMPDPPRLVEEDTEKWRLDADPILAYTTERLTRDDGYAITATDLQDDFNAWLERRGHRPWTGQTINSRFQGHVTMDGVERKMVKWSGRVKPSRPRNLFATKPIPRTTTSWRGVRFVEEDVATLPSEAELDAATLRDLERRATA